MLKDIECLNERRVDTQSNKVLVINSFGQRLRVKSIMASPEYYTTHNIFVPAPYLELTDNLGASDET